MHHLSFLSFALSAIPAHKIIIYVISTIVGVIFTLWYARLLSKYSIARLWTGVKKKANIVPINPETGRIPRVGDNVKIKESDGDFVLREILDDKKCICRNIVTDEIMEATLDDMYFLTNFNKLQNSTVPHDQKKPLYVCIHYLENFGLKNTIRGGRIGGGSNYIHNELYYHLSKYVPQYRIRLGKTISSMENYYFYHRLQQSLGIDDKLNNTDIDSYDNNLFCNMNHNGKLTKPDMLIVVDDNTEYAKYYISKAKEMGIDTFIING